MDAKELNSRIHALETELADLQGRKAKQRDRLVDRLIGVLPAFSPSRSDLDEVANGILDEADAVLDILAEWTEGRPRKPRRS